MAFMFVLPFEAIQVAFGRSLPTLLLPLLIIAALMRLLQRKPVYVWRPNVIAPVLLYFAWTALSFAWSSDPQASYVRVATLMTLFASIIAFTVLVEKKHLPWLSVAYLCGTSALTAAVLAAEPSSDLRRTAAGNANDVALFLVIGATILTFASMRTASWQTAFILGVATILHIVATLATGSRTAVLALAVGIGVILLRPGRYRRKRTLWLFGIPFVVALLASEFGAETSWLQRSASVIQNLLAGDLTGRQEIWGSILSQPLSLQGVGAGATATHLEETSNLSHAAHNAWLGTALELGLVGLALFALTIAAGVSLARGSDLAPVLIPLWLVVLIFSLSLSIEVDRALWFLLAVSALPSLSNVGAGASMNNYESKV